MAPLQKAICLEAVMPVVIFVSLPDTCLISILYRAVWRFAQLQKIDLKLQFSAPNF